MRAGIQRRGESSLRSLSSKPNLAVEAWNDLDDDRDVELLDFPEESDFILYAPWRYDRALLNNPLTFLAADDGNCAGGEESGKGMILGQVVTK